MCMYVYSNIEYYFERTCVGITQHLHKIRIRIRIRIFRSRNLYNIDIAYSRGEGIIAVPIGMIASANAVTDTSVGGLDAQPAKVNAPVASRAANVPG